MQQLSAAANANQLTSDDVALSRQGDDQLESLERHEPIISTAHGAVLVCDDDPGLRRALLDMIDAMGYPVVGASSGPDCLDILRDSAEDISLCVVDQLMPGLRGDEVIVSIRLDEPSMPIIWMSGHDVRSIPLVGASRDVVFPLTKPVTYAELEATIGVALGP